MQVNTDRKLNELRKQINKQNEYLSKRFQLKKKTIRNSQDEELKKTKQK